MTTRQRMKPQRSMTHDDVIQMITVVNAPRPGTNGSRSWKRGAQSIRKPVAGSAARCRQSTTANYDDESARTRRYWDEFAREATRELLKDAMAADDDGSGQRVMYSGRVGIEPKYPPKIDDGQSVATDLSLLTCSELAVGGGGGDRRRLDRRRRPVRRTIEPDAETRTNWAEVVRENYGGVLGRMLERDAGTLHAFADGSAGYSVLNKANLSNMFSDEEQLLLMRSSYATGTIGAEKSASAEDVTSALGGRPRRPLADGPSPTAGRSASVPSALHALAAAGGRRRSQSPPPAPRQRSMFGADAAGSRSAPAARPDSSGDYARHVRAQIHSTVAALGRVAGFGDDTAEMNAIPEERGLYTGADYARLPRYPQNIRVAPQLVHVIASEVERRVSQPRQYQLRQQDVYRFDRMQPSLDRASRNLFIFNWLNQLSERHFRAAPFPRSYRDGVDADDDVTEFVVAARGHPSNGQSGSESGRGRSDNSSYASSDVSYDVGSDVDSYGPAVGSLSDQSL